MRQVAVKAKQPSSSRVIKSRPKKKTRLDHVDGIRGLSIMLVVLYHVFIGSTSGGVDAFLLLGGMFFIPSQYRNAIKVEGMTFFQSFIRVIRRLSPSLIIVSFAAALYLISITNSIAWKPVLLNLSSAITYWTNWRLINLGEQYSVAGQDVSMFQHLWSMSAQMQTYVFIMALLAIIFGIARRFPKFSRPTKTFYAIVIFLTIASFIYAMYMMIWGRSEVNYYSTFSRFWEIGLGGIIGMQLHKFSVNNVKARWFLSTVGFTILITTGLWIDGTKQFPGYMALIPTLGTVMMVVAGLDDDSKGMSCVKKSGVVTWFLKTKFMVFMGNIAYNLYLWHWCILIVSLNVLDTPSLSIVQSIGVIALSIVIAVIMYYGVEKFLRQGEKPTRGNVFSWHYIQNARIFTTSSVYPAVAASMTVFTLILATSPLIYKGVEIYTLKNINKAIEKEGGVEQAYPGAEAYLIDKPVKKGVPLYPNPVDFSAMLPQTQEDGCFATMNDDKLSLVDKHGKLCEYGDKTAKRTMYLVGGSHSEEFLPALDQIGKRNEIKIIPFVKMGCPLYYPRRFDKDPYVECQKWSSEVESYIMNNPPTDGIFMTGDRSSTFWGSPPEIVPDYYHDTFARFSQENIPIYSMRDNPWMTNIDGPIDVRECVYEHGETSSKCTMPAQDYLAPVDPSIAAYADVPNIKLLDLTKAYVSQWGDVMPVIGNTLVFRDSHHLTKQYVLSMTNEIESQMKNNPWTPGTSNVLKENLKLEGAETAGQNVNSSNKDTEIIVPGQKSKEESDTITP